MSRYARVAFTDAVQRFQQERGSRPPGTRLGSAVGAHPDPLGERERDFITRRDGFHLGSVGETGWPYVQFRGGPPGFVHVLDEHTLAYADVRGNRQYITNGNLSRDGRVAMFFMDYAHRSRLKLFGHATLHDPDDMPEVLDAGTTDGRVERVVVIAVEGFDWNCPKHIPHRYSTADLAELHARLDRLEDDNRFLRRENDHLKSIVDGSAGGA